MNIRWFTELGSTNDALKQAVLAGEEIPDGTAWATTRQTAGRGRLGRVWTAPDGEALAISLWMTGAPHPAASLLLGLAVTRTMRQLTGADFRLKWPNDSICADRKVGGLLCEAVCMGEVQGTVAGVGLNLLESPVFFEQNHYCSPNYALSQFLWFDRLNNLTKICAYAPKMHMFDRNE